MSHQSDNEDLSPELGQCSTSSHRKYRQHGRTSLLATPQFAHDGHQPKRGFVPLTTVEDSSDSGRRGTPPTVLQEMNPLEGCGGQSSELGQYSPTSRKEY